jgi:circadian clock protein KaiC
VEGNPGSGKTILGMQFLHQGVIQRENGLFISFEEPADEILENTKNFGWNMRDVHIMTVLPNSENGRWYLPSKEDIKRLGDCFLMGNFIGNLRKKVHVLNIQRIVIDSLTALSCQYESVSELRRNILWLLTVLAELNCTTLLINENYTSSSGMEDFIARGIISLEKTDDRNLIEIKKMRGQDFVKGKHYFKIGTTGIRVFPNIELDNRYDILSERIETGVNGIDDMCRGGVVSGDATLLVGSPGTGKTLMGMTFLSHNAGENGKGIYISLKESASELISKKQVMSCSFKSLIARNQIQVMKPDLSSKSIEEHLYEIMFKTRDCDFVVVDSITGYRDYLEDGQYKNFIRKLLSIFKNNSITSFILAGTEEIFDFSKMEITGSLADNVILLRYFEVNSSVRKSINIIKMRACEHDTEVREYSITTNGVQVMTPLDVVRDISFDGPDNGRIQDLADVFGFDAVPTDIELPTSLKGDSNDL